MKKTNFSIKYTLYFLFFEENNKRIVTGFLSSNNHGGIIRSSFFLLKSFILFSIIYFGYPVSMYQFLVLFVSLSNSESIL